MVKIEEKLRCVNRKQLGEIVRNGLNYARISFRDETEPIFLAFKEKPTVDEISDFLKDSLGIIYNGEITISWSEINYESSK